MFTVSCIAGSSACFIWLSSTSWINLVSYFTTTFGWPRNNIVQLLFLVKKDRYSTKNSISWLMNSSRGMLIVECRYDNLLTTIFGRNLEILVFCVLRRLFLAAMTSFAARQAEIGRPDRCTERIYFAARRAARRVGCRAEMNRLIENIRSEKFQCRSAARRPPRVECSWTHLYAILLMLLALQFEKVLFMCYCNDSQIARTISPL